MSRGVLLRVLGVGFGLVVAIGGTVGAGILRAPGAVSALLPQRQLALVIWVLGGLYAACSAFGLAELAAMSPRAGGYTIYARRALGPWPAFVVGWADWFASCGSAAALAIFFADTVEARAGISRAAHHGLAVASVIAFTALQLGGVRWGSRAQHLTTVAKALGFLALIAACLLLPAHGAPSVRVLPSGAALLGATTLALQQVVWTFDGWHGAIYFAEELEDPGRALPRAILGTVALVTVLYVLVNVALWRALPLDEMAASTVPANVIVEHSWGARGRGALDALIAVSVLSTLNSLLLGAPRVLFGLAENKLFTPRALAVNAGGTPWVGLVASAALVVGFALSGAFDWVIGVTSVFLVAIGSLMAFCVFVLRAREPDAPRPYRAWGYPFTTGISLACGLAFLIAAIVGAPRTGLVALGLLALSVPVYLFSTRGK